MAKYSPQAQKFIAKRLRDFEAGKMFSGPKRQFKVMNPKQAQAIALSEARSKGFKVPKADPKIKARLQRAMSANVVKKAGRTRKIRVRK